MEYRSDMGILNSPTATAPTGDDGGGKRRRRRALVTAGCILPVMACAFGLPSLLRQQAPAPVRMARVVKPLKHQESEAVLGAGQIKPRADKWHPPHIVKVWTTKHKGRTFRVTQLPHCEHMETLITYDPAGETVKQAKIRTGGVAASSGSFHNSQTMALADFLQRSGSVLSPARTGRSFMAVHADGTLDISSDYERIKGKAGISALALGQRLLPLQNDGFSAAFMNKQTDRMAIGLNKSYIFLVQGKSDIWRLADFFAKKLPATVATNCDGGHVVRGKGPVHIVFRWKK